MGTVQSVGVDAGIRKQGNMSLHGKRPECLQYRNTAHCALTLCTHLRLVDSSETDRLFRLHQQPVQEPLAIHIPNNCHPFVSATDQRTPRVARCQVVDLTFMTSKQGIDVEEGIRHWRSRGIRRSDLP